MTNYDVFNGDADGICSLHQLRLEQPAEAELVTGIKRDIRLVERLSEVSGAEVTVLDISFDANRAAVEGLLARDCRVLYFDHHSTGELPEHPALESHIEPLPRLCTGLLVDRYLGGRRRQWAVVAAYGDNLVESAEMAATPLDLKPEQLAGLRELGELLNYNGYGESLEDLHFHPEALYRAVSGYAEPLEFLAAAPEVERLREGMAADMALARGREPLAETAGGRLFRLPCLPWARRVMGVHANELANADPAKAVALIVENSGGSLRVSVRAPLNRPAGADTLCRAFPHGGGRPGAGGINALPESQLPNFIKAFRGAFG